MLALDLKTRFCTNAHGELVDIRDLRAEMRDARGPYICLGCGNRMLPVLGKIRAHHFRHATDVEIDCSYETYLHRAAKMAVVEGFTRACSENKPYQLTRNRRVRCMAAAQFFPEGCSRKEAPEVFDLTQWLDCAREEVGIEGFVADVLLTKMGQQARLLIEIEVTHACDPAKLESGLPILEARVSSEKDIERLFKGITIDSDTARGVNLTPLKERETGRCTSCPNDQTVFIIYRSGKVLLSTKSRRELKKTLANPGILHWEVVTRDYARYRIVERYDALIHAAHYERGLPTRTCLQCRYGAIAKDTSTPMFCFKQRGKTLPTKINQATNCMEYSPIPTYEELLEVRNLQYIGTPPSLDVEDEDRLIED